MKTRFNIPVPCGISVLLLAWFTATLQAQTYSIDWFKVAGGGGTSTGGVYSVSGTGGQSDSGGANDRRQLLGHRRLLEPHLRGPHPRRAAARY